MYSILHNKMLVSRNILFKFREPFSHFNKRFPVQSENLTKWKSAFKVSFKRERKSKLLHFQNFGSQKGIEIKPEKRQLLADAIVHKLHPNLFSFLLLTQWTWFLSTYKEMAKG